MIFNISDKKANIGSYQRHRGAPRDNDYSYYSCQSNNVEKAAQSSEIGFAELGILVYL